MSEVSLFNLRILIHRLFLCFLTSSSGFVGKHFLGKRTEAGNSGTLSNVLLYLINLVSLEK